MPQSPQSSAVSEPVSTVRLSILSLLFFLSGSTGLILQVIWMYRLGLVFGNAVYATAATLTAFFLGLAIGGWLWGNAVTHLRSPLRVYALMELGIALSALLWLPGVEFYQTHYATMVSSLGNSRVLLIAMKFIFSTLLLLLPTIFMGGTFPVLAHYIGTGPQQLAQRGTWLYALNTLGAATGALATGFFLLSNYGVSTTYTFALLLITGVGIAAFALDMRTRRHETPATKKAASPTEIKTAAPLPHMLLLAFSTGLLALSAEVLWTRMFAQVLQNSVYSFSAILVTFLIALGLGGLIAHLLVRLSIPVIPALLALLCLGTLLVATSPLLFDHLTNGLAYVAARASWPAYLGTVFKLTFLVVFPPTLVIGAVFPFLLKAARAGKESAGPFVGKIVLLNSLGSSLGPLIAGFFLLDWIGLWGSIKLLAMAYGALALRIAISAGAERQRFWVALAGSGIIFALLTPSPPLLRLGPGQKALDILQASDGVVSVVQSGDNIQLRLDNYYLLGDSRSALVEQMQGHIPLLLHPAPKRTLFLGMGTGITAGAALNHNSERIVTVELIPNVIRAAKRYMTPWTNGLFRDPRVEIIADDARNYLLGTQEKFDVIVGDLFTPWHAGTGSLYTVEHFRQARQHLAPGGLFAQWLPLYQLTPESFATIAASFASVFPTVTLWRADFSGERASIALIGQEAGVRLDNRVLQRNITNVVARDSAETTTPQQHMAGLFYLGNWRALAPKLKDVPLNTDDRRTVEFMAPVSSQQANAGQGRFIVGKELESLLRALRTAIPPDKDPYLTDLPPRERRYVEVGFLYYRYLLLKAAGDTGEESEKILARITELAPDFAIRGK